MESALVRFHQSYGVSEAIGVLNSSDSLSAISLRITVVSSLIRG